MPRLARAAALGAAWSLAALRASAAQWSASLDVAASRVEYDGFLPSAAFATSPAVRFTTPNASFAARGTWLGFESGNTSVQGSLAGSVFTPAFGQWRGEVSANTGASSYATLASFSHALARGRVHYFRDTGGLWLSATLGRASYDNSTRTVAAAAAGVWHGRGNQNVTLTLAATQVGDISFANLEWSGYWQAGRVELEGSLGARGGGAGKAVYGEAGATWSLSRAVAMTLGVGRYPTDPVRGAVAGSYASIGLRLRGPSPRSDSRVGPAWPRPPVVPIPVGGSNSHLATATAAVELVAGGFTLVVRAPGVAIVEVMGDFTDWQPVMLARVGEEWRLTGRLASGLRRLNVRLDGGPWSVPMGATLAQDEFGAVVGTIVVP